jgi:hypothetical protein
MTTDSRRLSILTAQEIDDLYGLPRFTEDDRRLYFDLSPTERDLVDGVRTMSAAVHLLFQGQMPILRLRARGGDE